MEEKRVTVRADKEKLVDSLKNSGQEKRAWSEKKTYVLTRPKSVTGRRCRKLRGRTAAPPTFEYRQQSPEGQYQWEGEEGKGFKNYVTV